jgi:hypothetical protein
LGFVFYRRDGKVKIGMSRKAPKRAKQRLRQLTARTWGIPMERRIHAIRTRRRGNLRALGMPERAAGEWAASQKGPWRIAGSYVVSRAPPNAYWTERGLKGFTDPYHRFRDAERTARCGPAPRVVW